MAKHNTSKARNKRQKAKTTYRKKREDAQLSGEIPTTPEEALQDERVEPAAQGEQAIPALDRAAIRKGWSVPEDKKAAVIDRLVGVVLDENTGPHDVSLNARVLLQADQKQWERDHPEEAGKARGVSKVEVKQEVVDLKALFERVDRSREEAQETPEKRQEGDGRDDLQDAGRESGGEDHRRSDGPMGSEAGVGGG